MRIVSDVEGSTGLGAFQSTGAPAELERPTGDPRPADAAGPGGPAADQGPSPDGAAAGGAPAFGPLAAWASLATASQVVVGSASRAWELGDRDLLDVLVAHQVAVAQQDAARLAIIRELDARGIAAQDGATSTAAFLAHRLLVDGARAASDVRAARALDPAGDQPPAPGAPTPSRTRPDVVLAATGRDLAAGDITRAHAEVITRLVRSLPAPADHTRRDDLRARAEAFLLEHARKFCPSDLRRLARHLRHLVDPDGALGDERQAERTATFWMRPDAEGPGLRFGGLTDAVIGAQLRTFIEAHSGPRPDTHPDTGEPTSDRRTADQRRGEAFAHLVRTATGADQSTSGGTGVQLIITTSLQTLLARLGQKGLPCAETETGQPLSAATARRLACDAGLIPTVLGSHSEPLDVGRATRTIPPAIRRALILRDGGCAFPGCTRPPRWTDAHHITHWADGGPTKLTNLVLLCGHHHDTIHHTPWTVRITHGHPVFHPPNTREPNTHERPPPR
jgi:hypothetical protein